MRNKKVVITGATGRLGRGIALEFERLGAKVAPLKFDAAKVDNFENIVKRAAKLLGGIDILVNSAGIFYRTPIQTATSSDWDEFFNVNLRAPFFLSKFAAPFLKKGRPGRIINIADTYGASPSAGFVPYGASKAGLIAMTKGLAKELAPDVLVNCVCPGVIENPPIPPFSKGGNSKSPPFAKGGRGGFDKRAINATLLKRPVRAQDVVEAIVFLARNSSMTGQAVFVDCGRWV